MGGGGGLRGGGGKKHSPKADTLDSMHLMCVLSNVSGFSTSTQFSSPLIEFEPLGHMCAYSKCKYHN